MIKQVVEAVQLLLHLDAVFTYLCGQRIWNTLPCVLLTGVLMSLTRQSSYNLQTVQFNSELSGCHCACVLALCTYNRMWLPTAKRESSGKETVRKPSDTSPRAI